MSHIIVPTRAQKPPFGATLDRNHPLSVGLVACWPLSEGVGKSVNNLAGANAIYTTNTAATWQGTLGSQWGGSPRGTVGVFDGSTNYIDPATKLIFPAGSNFTLAAWFRWTQAVGSTLSFYLLDSSNGTTQNGAGLYLHTTATLLQIGFNVRDSSAHSINALTTVTGISDNTWHLLVGVRDQQAATLRTYLDGRVIQTGLADTTTGAIGGTNNIAIGAVSPGHASKYNAQMDMPCVWNRALSAGEIQRLYVEPYGMFSGGLFSYYPPYLWQQLIDASSQVPPEFAYKPEVVGY